MKKIKEEDRIKYVGLSNRLTYKQDLEMNSLGTIIMALEIDGKIYY